MDPLTGGKGNDSTETLNNLYCRILTKRREQLVHLGKASRCVRFSVVCFAISSALSIAAILIVLLRGGIE